MAQARIDYGKVIAPRPFGAEDISTQRIDIFKFLMISMILFTVVSTFHVWSRFKLVDLNLEISEISKKVKEAENEQKRLKLEAATLKTPARIEMIAKNNLKMALPGDRQIIQVK
ncbi:MAG: cell division protein FtsL [Geobacteraceae bacterium GWC2_48_7]|nr:MAG: cell division protein FtsL [Geobacteraceae bacterium GWC2_48_7]